MEDKEAMFWADSIAKQVVTRKKFRYLDKEITLPKKLVVKTSASLSGVLHIGRLSDTVRGEAVVRALSDLGYNAELIWVAEDMDPLRKVPEGVPKNYAEYIGMPVSDIPDPWGCHESYAEHHESSYFDVLKAFVGTEMKKYSMRAEYRKGSFNKYIKLLLDKIELVREIQNRYRTTPLPVGWSPWTPICEKCGKIITPRVTGIENGKIHYTCKDYRFEKYTAKGCGHESLADPFKGEGKLMWKSEWAAQWIRWKVVAEGAGKEYQVPTSAFWVNAEIVEKVLGFPSPVPIFYEHIMINGKKMSASLGNVIYPKEWLEVARPEVLRYFYCKKLMKTRSFSWVQLPNLHDEFDRCARIYHGLERADNDKEERHLKRLYRMSQVESVLPYIPLSYSHAAMVAQLFKDEDRLVEALKRTGHFEEKLKDLILERVAQARRWVRKYAPAEQRIEIKRIPEKNVLKRLSEKTKNALIELGEALTTDQKKSEEELIALFREIAEKNGMQTSELFKAFYLCVLGRERGPRATTLILSLGTKKIGEVLLKLK